MPDSAAKAAQAKRSLQKQCSRDTLQTANHPPCCPLKCVTGNPCRRPPLSRSPLTRYIYTSTHTSTELAISSFCGRQALPFTTHQDASPNPQPPRSAAQRGLDCKPNARTQAPHPPLKSDTQMCAACTALLGSVKLNRIAARITHGQACCRHTGQTV